MYAYSEEQIRNIILSLEKLTVQGVDNCNLVSNISYIINNPCKKMEEAKESEQVIRTVE